MLCVQLKEKFEDIKDVVKSCEKSLKMPNQNRYIEEGQTTQWTKEKQQKDKQWYAKYYIENLMFIFIEKKSIVNVVSYFKSL